MSDRRSSSRQKGGPTDKKTSATPTDASSKKSSSRSSSGGEAKKSSSSSSSTPTKTPGKRGRPPGSSSKSAAKSSSSKTSSKTPSKSSKSPAKTKSILEYFPKEDKLAKKRPAEKSKNEERRSSSSSSSKKQRREKSHSPEKKKPSTPSKETKKAPASKAAAGIPLSRDDEVQIEFEAAPPAPRPTAQVVRPDPSALAARYTESTGKKAVVLCAAGLTTDIQLGKGTSDKCGQCRGCRNRPCGECSACKRMERDKCIDKYCSQQESGRAERAAIKEMYLKSILSGQSGGDAGSGSALGEGAAGGNRTITVVRKPNTVVPESVSRILANSRVITGSGATALAAGARVATSIQLSAQTRPVAAPSKSNEGQENAGKKSLPFSGPKRNLNYVYGAGNNSSKQRRCGECEGCMRDDCGECLACLDKPRFGGRGTKKRACAERICRMKAAEAGNAV